jgi:hypothetical protein
MRRAVLMVYSNRFKILVCSPRRGIYNIGLGVHERAMMMNLFEKHCDNAIATQYEQLPNIIYLIKMSFYCYKLFQTKFYQAQVLRNIVLTG